MTTLNGLNVAAVKPKATATRLIERPTSESQPRAREIATAIGTSVTDSSRIPAVELKSIHTKIIMHKSRYFFFSNFLIMTAMMYLSMPCSSRIRKVPPMRTMKSMIAMPVVTFCEPNTSTSDAGIFHTGSL